MCDEPADETLYDLKIDFLEDGGVNLEQSAGCGESHYMTLHLVHVRLMAERVGLIPANDPHIRIKELEAALRLLAAVAHAEGTPEHLRSGTLAVVASVGVTP